MRSVNQFDLFGKRVTSKTTYLTPHLNKLNAALENPKCERDQSLIKEAIELYHEWIEKLDSLSSRGKERVKEMVELLNWYKDEFEVEMIMKRGTSFLKRQKGQLKLDNSILEEFFIRLIHPDIIDGLENLENLVIGPENAFMSLAFIPQSFKQLGKKPNVAIKTKDQDFVIGTRIFYKFSPNESFTVKDTTTGSLTLAILAAECKVNLDKTMFQEAAGTAERLKHGCPVAKYFVLVEYLDMEPEDCRLTKIDNVFLLRHARRLPFEKRNIVEEVERQHKEFPIDPEVVWKFVQEIQTFVSMTWYEPEKALERGSFV